MSGTLQAEMLARLAEAPQARCLAFYRAGEAVRWRSRAEVHRRAVDAARRLADEGLRPGEVCVIVLPSGEPAATLLLGTLLLGAVPLLIAPPSLMGGNLDLRETLADTLRRARARIAICAASLAPDLPLLRRRAPGTRCLPIEEWALSDADRPAARASAAQPGDGDRDVALSRTPQSHVADGSAADGTGADGTGADGTAAERIAADADSLHRATARRPSEIAALQLTSGTTGAPRICAWDHRAILAALDGMAAAMALEPDDVCFNWTPLYHDMGLVNNFLLCLVRGVPLVLLSPQEFIRRPAAWLRGLSETGATVTWSPNFGFAVTTRKAADAELAGVRLHKVRAWWNAAERIHLETMEAFEQRFRALGLRRGALKTNYGCAENVGGATFSALDAPPRHERVDRRLLDELGIARTVASPPALDHETSLDSDDAAVSIVSAGRAHPGLRVMILSPRGRALPDGRVGEICLDTPSRLIGYLRNARATARALRGGLLHTGDLGYLRGGELFWVGRLRERITVQGRKVDPSAFESVLASTPGLREGCFAAFGVPDAQRGTERVIVVSEARVDQPDDVTALAGTIRRRCFLQLGIGPDDVLLVRAGTLAKTSSGKRRHRHVRALYLAGGLDALRLPLVERPVLAAAAAPHED